MHREYDMRVMIGRLALTAVLLCATAMPASAATPSEFYATLLRRGVAAYDGGRFEEATRQLRLAAFGMVESVPDYQLAHVYLALAHSKNGEESRARDSARKVTVAERVERRYAALSLPAGVRSAFETLATRLLSQSEASTLRGTVTPVPLSATPLSATPPSSTPPSATPAPATNAQPRGTSASTTPANPPPQTAATQPRNSAQNTTTNPPRPQPQTSQPATTTTAPPVIVDRVEVETQRATPPRTEPQRPPAQTTTQPQTTQPQTASSAPATSAQTQPQRTETPRTQPQPAQSQPANPPRRQTTSPSAPILSPSQMASRLSSADRALDGANLTEARRLYRELLAAPNADRDTLIRTAEGLYRSRDFAATLSAFQRIGTLRRGEEPYRYYIAVALYETGQYQRAKSELAAVLPYIEVTPDVARYRTKIEGAAR